MVNESTYLIHHGIKGQKWGVRRYQNPDGTLTEAGKKKYAKVYEKEMNKWSKNAFKNAQDTAVKAYNKTVEQHNNGKIDEYNKKHKPSEPGYFENYEQMFENDVKKNFNDMYLSQVKNNKHYKKAQAIVNKYKDLKSTELVMKVDSFMKDFETYGLDPVKILFDD